MLVVIFGVSCVGKSTIIEQLVKEGCKSIRVFTTRELRGGENTKIHLSDEMFELYMAQNKFIWTNNFFNIKYGTSSEDVLNATSSDEIFLLDYALSKELDLRNISCIKIILIPENLETLVIQIKAAKRVERMKEILAEYETYYTPNRLEEYKRKGFKVVTNHYLMPQYAIAQVQSLINLEGNDGSI